MAMIAPREILRLASAMPHPDAQRTDTHQALLDRCMIVALRVQTGRPIRRVLSGCRVAATSVTAISLGTTLPQPSSGLPGNSASSLNVPCLTLLRTRFTQRARSLGPLVVSYTTVSPLPPVRGLEAVCSLLHFLADCSGWVLPTVLLCGARTFLGTLPKKGDATAWPTRLRAQA